MELGNCTGKRTSFLTARWNERETAICGVVCRWLCTLHHAAPRWPAGFPVLAGARALANSARHPQHSNGNSNMALGDRRSETTTAGGALGCARGRHPRLGLAVRCGDLTLFTHATYAHATNGRPGFPFGFLGAGGRLPKARRGRVFIVQYYYYAHATKKTMPFGAFFLTTCSSQK